MKSTWRSSWHGLNIGKWHLGIYSAVWWKLQVLYLHTEQVQALTIIALKIKSFCDAWTCRSLFYTFFHIDSKLYSKSREDEDEMAVPSLNRTVPFKITCHFYPPLSKFHFIFKFWFDLDPPSPIWTMSSNHLFIFSDVTPKSVKKIRSFSGLKFYLSVCKIFPFTNFPTYVFRHSSLDEF